MPDAWWQWVLLVGGLTAEVCIVLRVIDYFWPDVIRWLDEQKKRDAP